MPTAIRNVELTAPISSLDGLDGYDRVMLVGRWRGRVIGRAFAQVRSGSVGSATIQNALARSIGDAGWRRWLDEVLDEDDRRTIGFVPPSATVAICTRERPDDLRRALAAVAVLEGDGHELLVIDNAPSTDRTRRVVETFPQVRYVLEPEPGLNAARNRALREARREIVAFTDDDAAPEPEWLRGLVANFGDPRVMCVTGLTLPVELETEAQELFEEHCPFSRGFSRRVFDGQIDNPLAVGPVGAGANMAVRRSLLARVGEFERRLDGGTPARSGGDHEMFARILGCGYRIAYDPAAVSWHRHRRTKAELMDTVYGYGVGVYAMWTGMLLERRELGALKLAWAWLRHEQLPVLLRRRSDRRSDARAELVRTELRGCLHGPRAWFAARRLRTHGA